MTAKKLSFEVVRDNVTADPTKRYILRVKIGGTSVLAPRYSFLHSALDDVSDFIDEYAPKQKNVKVEINL